MLTCLWNLLNASAPTFCRCSSTVAAGNARSALYHGVHHTEGLTDVAVILEARLLVRCFKLMSVSVIANCTT